MNDNFVGTKDRWRTGSIATSFVWGPDWAGTPPETLGQLLEFRLLGQVIAPESLRSVRLNDRRYAGALSFGLHTHQRRANTDISLGADLVITGPQTGLDSLQTTLHDIPGIPGPSRGIRARQIGNAAHLAAVFEIAQQIDLAANAHIRPFLELRAGEETLARVGVDVTLGQRGKGGLMVRDPVTGHRYRVVDGTGSGLSFVLGADVARVASSIYLPNDSALPGITGATADNRLPNRLRERIRAGVHWQGRKAAMFYGLTWHGREFRSQRQDQLTGAIQLSVRF